MGQEEDLRRMSALAEQAAQAAANGSAAGLALLLAEMQALFSMMPGMMAGSGPAADSPEAEAAARRADAEVEAGFDNMPV